MSIQSDSLFSSFASALQESRRTPSSPPDLFAGIEPSWDTSARRFFQTDQRPCWHLPGLLPARYHAKPASSYAVLALVNNSVHCLFGAAPCGVRKPLKSSVYPPAPFAQDSPVHVKNSHQRFNAPMSIGALT